MLVIKSFVEKSNIEGLGLFTAQKINKGDIIWFYDPVYDQVFYEDEFKKMLSVLEIGNQEKLKKWIYKRRDNYVLCSDNAKFWNHSDTPNCGEGNENEIYDIALRDIEEGEELTYMYDRNSCLNNREECPFLYEEKEKSYEKEGKEIGEEIGKT